MDNALLVAGDGATVGRRVRLRVSAVVVGLALVFAALIVVQHRADAAPAAAVAAVSVPSVSAADAQINFSQFICATLLTVRNAFSASPFFSFVAAAISPLLVAFGCSTS